jgi:hypothetical protein
MSRRTRLDFKPLTLGETAKALGVPPARARKILALVGVDYSGLATGGLRTRKSATGNVSPRRANSRRPKTTAR